jgi:N-methylhydantoinase A
LSASRRSAGLNKSPRAVWVGIDTGGTFTDLVAIECESGRYHFHKVPTLTADPARGILEGIAELLQAAGLAAGNVQSVVLGTTLATNAVLEGKWAKTGMLTTAGFRDVLELARQRRPHYFNLDIPKPVPPAPRDCRLEIAGRIAYDGSEVTSLAEADIERAVTLLKSKRVEAVAICFLHSYANPRHEERTREIVKKLWPEAYLCTSSDVLAEFREFERFATATVNASLMPVMDRYMEKFERGVRALGVRNVPRVMQSNGGAVSPRAVRKAPVNTFFSGPAGGVIGSVAAGAHVGAPNLITFDMGGTSTDVSLIREGEPGRKSERTIGGFPVRARTLDIHTIGAGGGSIAWVDAGGLLKVGPQSAGAFPGPAAYGRGGTQPSVTDANVVLGRLNPKALLGGRMPMHADKAEGALDALAQKLGVDRTRAAAGVIEIINVNMMGAVRVISIEQGEDPRDFTLVAFGGAGPLHGADVARNMGIRNVMVPPRPGLLSAIGLLHAELRADFSLTRLVRADRSGVKSLNAGLRMLAKRGAQWLQGERESRGTFRWFADLRYAGQNFELAIELGADRLDEAATAALAEAFHRRHKDFYGYDLRAQPVEIVNLRLALTGERPLLPHDKSKRVRGMPKDAVIDKRRVWFSDEGHVPTLVYDRDRLAVDARVTGPAIIEQMDTTTVVPPRASVRVDRAGYLHMSLGTTEARRSAAWLAA